MYTPPHESSIRTVKYRSDCSIRKMYWQLRVQHNVQPIRPIMCNIAQIYLFRQCTMDGGMGFLFSWYHFERMNLQYINF